MATTSRVEQDIFNSLETVHAEAVGKLGQKALAYERLLEISREISSLNFETAVDRILTSVLELTGAQRGALLLCENGGRLSCVRSAGSNGAGARMSISYSLAREAVASGELQIVANTAVSAVGQRTSVLELGLGALVAIPLQSHDRVLGVLYVDTDVPAKRMATCDRAVLAAFGSQAAITLDNARLHSRLQKDCLFLRRSLEDTLRFDRLIYRSQGMHRACEAARQVMDSDVSVLVLGETGTGKGLMARAMHFNSHRKKHRFTSQNVGALPDSLLESELFGHRRGAFSGAVESKPGLVEVADGGTLFLDEIGEASPALQVCLLRFLETGAFRRVGETGERRTDVRVVAATHRDLEAEVRGGRFREDLYYRLNIFPIHIPPLRERREDIEPLVHHFIGKHNSRLGKSIRSVSRQILAELGDRDWPGNVRELENVIQRLIVMSPGDELAWPDAGPITAPLAPVSEATAGPETAPFPTLAEIEREHLRRALAASGGNQAKAARLLGLKRGTFRARLKKLGL